MNSTEYYSIINIARHLPLALLMGVAAIIIMLLLKGILMLLDKKGDEDK